jgi:hypothetical protein
MSGLTEPQIKFILFRTHAPTNSTFFCQNVPPHFTLHRAFFSPKRRLEVVDPNTGSSEERHIKKRDLTTISRREHI